MFGAPRFSGALSGHRSLARRVNVSIGTESGPRIGVQKGTPVRVVAAAPGGDARSRCVIRRRSTGLPALVIRGSNKNALGWRRYLSTSGCRFWPSGSPILKLQHSRFAWRRTSCCPRARGGPAPGSDAAKPLEVAADSRSLSTRVRSQSLRRVSRNGIGIPEKGSQLTTRSAS